MSFETDFDTAFTILLGKAQQTITQTDPSTTTVPPSTTPVATVTSYDVVFCWGGGGAAITAATTDPIVVEIPDDGEIVWCHLYATNSSGAPVDVFSASFDLQSSSYSGWGTFISVAGSGSSPQIINDSNASTDLTGWHTALAAGQVLVGRLTALSGTVRTLSMVLKVRRGS